MPRGVVAARAYDLGLLEWLFGVGCDLDTGDRDIFEV
jgi:hypothetical protein